MLLRRPEPAWYARAIGSEECDQERLVREKARCGTELKHGGIISRVRNPPGQRQPGRPVASLATRVKVMGGKRGRQRPRRCVGVRTRGRVKSASKTLLSRGPKAFTSRRQHHRSWVMAQRTATSTGSWYTASSQEDDPGTWETRALGGEPEAEGEGDHSQSRMRRGSRRAL